jgi:hypothetical protein
MKAVQRPRGLNLVSLQVCLKNDAFTWHEPIAFDGQAGSRSAR